MTTPREDAIAALPCRYDPTDFDRCVTHGGHVGPARDKCDAALAAADDRGTLDYESEWYRKGWEAGHATALAAAPETGTGGQWTRENAERHDAAHPDHASGTSLTCDDCRPFLAAAPETPREDAIADDEMTPNEMRRRWPVNVEYIEREAVAAYLDSPEAAEGLGAAMMREHWYAELEDATIAAASLLAAMREQGR